MSSLTTHRCAPGVCFWGSEGAPRQRTECEARCGRRARLIPWCIYGQWNGAGAHGGLAGAVTELLRRLTPRDPHGARLQSFAEAVIAVISDAQETDDIERTLETASKARPLGEKGCVRVWGGGGGRGWGCVWGWGWGWRGEGGRIFFVGRGMLLHLGALAPLRWR